MPGLFYEPISRKVFLNTSAKALGMLAFGSATHSFASETGGSDAESVRFSLLSDTHIPADPTNQYRGFFPTGNLQQVVPQVLESSPAAVLITGDAARLEGLTQDYRALRKILKPLAEQFPIYIALGNHDDRTNFYEVFDGPHPLRQPVNQKHVLVVETGPLRFVVLDSLLYVNRVAGLLGKAQRTWLTQYLAEADEKPVVLMVHHTLGDGDGDLLDSDRLFGMLRQHSQVKAIFYGHSHRYAVEQREGVQLINLPAVGYNFDDAQPVGWIDAVFHSKGVGLTLRAIGGNRKDDGRTVAVHWT